MRSSLVKFTTAAAMVSTLAVAIATTPEARDGAGAFAASVGLRLLGIAAIASATHSAPGYGYGPRYYPNDTYAYRGSWGDR
jgi:hypothetical protein